MKKFENFEELLKELGIEFSSEVKYCKGELSSFLENVGSDVVENEDEEPISSFEIEFENKKLEIGVTSIEINEEYGDCKYYYWLIDFIYINQEIKQDIKENLFNEIRELNKKYEKIKYKINLEKANGNLSKLCNLNMEFDENFDSFFDDEDLRKKYNDWNYEENCIKLEKTNADLLEDLDEEDLNGYIEFYKNYIGQLEDELKELKEVEEEF